MGWANRRTPTSASHPFVPIDTTHGKADVHAASHRRRSRGTDPHAACHPAPPFVQSPPACATPARHHLTVLVFAGVWEHHVLENNPPTHRPPSQSPTPACLPVYPYDRSTRLIVYPCHHPTTSLRVSFSPSACLSASPSMRDL